MSKQFGIKMIEVVDKSSKIPDPEFHPQQVQPAAWSLTKMEHHLLTLCVLPVVMLLVGWAEAAPAHDFHQRQVEQANGPHDVRWKLVSGLETAYFYIQKLSKQMKVCNDNQPLLSASEELKTILDGVCELMAVQTVASKVGNGTDLQSILEQNIIDSCHWLNYLAASGEITASAGFLELNDTCEIDNMPRLSSYCLETKMTSFYNRVYEPASDYYSGTVEDQSVVSWLDSQLPPSQKDSVLQTIYWLPGQNFTCPFHSN